MDLLYIASTEPRSGKTVLAAGLGLLARASGARPVYRKLTDGAPGEEDADVRFVGGLLGEAGALAGSNGGWPALESLASQADLVLLEGGADPARDAALAAAAGARVVLLVWYREGMPVREVQAAADSFAGRLAGLVLNGVPRLRLHHAETELLPSLRRDGLPVLGVLPQSRVLMAPTLGELVAFLGAEVIAFPEGLGELVERIMVGALALDGGLYYFGQTDRKVVITRWDRPDLQMPALATGCQGLILTGGQGPIPYVWNRVQELRVPVAVIPGGTIAAASFLNEGFLTQRGRPHARKAEEMASLLPQLPELLQVVRTLGAGG